VKRILHAHPGFQQALPTRSIALPATVLRVGAISADAHGPELRPSPGHDREHFLAARLDRPTREVLAHLPEPAAPRAPDTQSWRPSARMGDASGAAAYPPRHRGHIAVAGAATQDHPEVMQGTYLSGGRQCFRLRGRLAERGVAHFDPATERPARAAS
jgi:hypothetical protein